MSGFNEPRRRCPQCDEIITARQMRNHINGARCRRDRERREAEMAAAVGKENGRGVEGHAAIDPRHEGDRPEAKRLSDQEANGAGATARLHLSRPTAGIESGRPFFLLAERVANGR